MSWFAEYKKSLKMIEVEEFFDLFFYRPLAFILVKTVYRTNITPNQLTLIAILFGLIAGFVYSMGTDYFVCGAICFALYNIIDCSDGQLARIKKNGTHAGRIVDGLADYISTAAVFIGIGIGGMEVPRGNTSPVGGCCLCLLLQAMSFSLRWLIITAPVFLTMCFSGKALLKKISNHSRQE